MTQDVAILILCAAVILNSIAIVVNAWYAHKDRIEDGDRWFRHWTEHYEDRQP